MTYEEKGTWVYLVACAGTYAAYLAIILGRVGATPIADVPYAATLLWTVGASIVISIVGRIAFETAKPSDTRRSDARDKEIYRFGEYATRWFVILAAVAALAMAMARWDDFWIANVIYLGFVLSAVVGSVVKLVAYRRGM
jgi:branched-subunit amino acid ABC-type transport system permease component